MKHHVASLILVVLFWSSCERDSTDQVIDNEQELITTVTLTFKAPDGTIQDFGVRDLDGTGGEPPMADDISLSANTTYTLFVKFLDESDPMQPVDLTDEIRDEDTDHLICFITTSDLPTPQPIDYDVNAQPLGLEATLATGEATLGFLTVRLKHLPDKGASDPCATGGTDVEVSFLVEVK